jgi:hypothetical protein
MEVSFRYDPQKNIYFKTVSGKVTYDEAVSSLNPEGVFDFSKNIYVIEDSTKAVVAFPLNKLYGFVNHSMQHFPKDILIFHALVTNSKIVTAFAFIIKRIFPNHRYQLNIFSTHKKAMEWILNKQKIYGELPPK